MLLDGQTGCRSGDRVPQPWGACPRSRAQSFIRGSQGREMDVPDAPRDRARRPWLVSDLRHGAGADDAERGRWTKPGIDRYDAPLLDWRCARDPGPGAGDGPASL